MHIHLHDEFLHPTRCRSDLELSIVRQLFTEQFSEMGMERQLQEPKYSSSPWPSASSEPAFHSLFTKSTSALLVLRAKYLEYYVVQCTFELGRTSR